MKKNKKVIIAMSGGVDSSVAAALLKKQNFDVVGVFMKFWSNGKCCTPESEKKARLVAEKLNIPFYVFNFEKEFKNKVVDYFSRNYKFGLTPNPCVICNKEIKFGLLFKKALSLDADYIAFGHYVRNKGAKLFKAKDRNKDQSYFLWKLNQRILKKTLFPIGDYTKPEIRSLAKKFKLPILDIKESQDICFKVKFDKKPGNIIDTDKKIKGKHKGLWFYTIGQRKGIGLGRGPFYVLDKDIKKNILIVTKNKKDLYKKEMIIKDINWISEEVSRDARGPEDVAHPLKVMAQIRYRYKPSSAIIKKNKVIFNKSQKAITPGQSVVFYKGQQLLGGAIIRS